VLERAKDTPKGFQCETGDASTESRAWITIARASPSYSFSGVRDIPRSKGTAARADGLVIKFERADAVEDIMTKARGLTHGAARVFYAKGWECEHEGGECL